MQINEPDPMHAAFPQHWMRDYASRVYMMKQIQHCRIKADLSITLHYSAQRLDLYMYILAITFNPSLPSIIKSISVFLLLSYGYTYDNCVGVMILNNILRFLYSNCTFWLI